MKRRFLILFGLATLLSGVVFGQTTVTGTFTDTDGQTWNNGPYTITFAGSSYSGQTVFNGFLSGTGTLSISIPTVTSGTITPWTFQICPYTSAISACQTQTIGINPSGSQSITSNFGTLTAPRFPSGPLAFGYLDAEVQPQPQSGSPVTTYIRLSDNSIRCWAVNVWAGCGGGGGSTAWSSITSGANAQTGAFSTAGPWTFSAAGAASTPGLSITGVPFSGGTGTTTFPQFYLNSGTAPTTWSTSGTVLGINAPSGFIGNLIDAHVNGGVSLFSVSPSGAGTFNSTLFGSKLLTGNCTSSASPAVCSTNSSGTVVVAAAATTVQVNTTAVSANSIILLTFDSSLGTKLSVTCNTTIIQPTVSARTAGSNFTITVSAAPVTNPACISYLVIN